MEINTNELVKSFESLLSGISKSIEGTKTINEKIEKMEKEVIEILNKL